MVEPASSRALRALLTAVYRPLLRRAAREALEGRLLDRAHPERGRWLRPEVDAYLAAVWRHVPELLPEARLEELPTVGNRHNVFLAVVTTAAYRTLVERGVERDHAAELVADVGWKIYARMLRLAALPTRWLHRDPALRMERTLQRLMRFPFSAPGRPGYEVELWSEGGRVHTHWTHCPPQTFVRRLVEHRGDGGELEAFFRSWCLYDWPGADLIAGDGERGHYERRHTLSRGDAVCDMCWHGRARREGTGAVRPCGAPAG